MITVDDLAKIREPTDVTVQGTISGSIIEELSREGNGVRFRITPVDSHPLDDVRIPVSLRVRLTSEQLQELCRLNCLGGAVSVTGKYHPAITGYGTLHATKLEY